MTVTAGVNHIALITEDLDRFVRFYTEVIGASVIAELDEDGLRHAMLDVGRGAGLHAFEQAGHPDATASRATFARGHLDHFALNLADRATFEAVRTRLVDAGASDGTITDFGSVLSVSFVDPDGCDLEIALWQDGPTRTFADRQQIAYVRA
jgi:catechol 2,3-dioxygenase-like lactoylglutathione lyase family enzyme